MMLAYSLLIGSHACATTAMLSDTFCVFCCAYYACLVSLVIVTIKRAAI